jgi:hypothetical protein
MMVWLNPTQIGSQLIQPTHPHPTIIIQLVALFLILLLLVVVSIGYKYIVFYKNSMDLNQLRQKIASLDGHIVTLLNERASYSLEVGLQKRRELEETNPYVILDNISYTTDPLNWHNII